MRGDVVSQIAAVLGAPLLILLAISDQVTLVAQTVVILVVAVGAIWTIRAQRTSEWRSRADALDGENKELHRSVTELRERIESMPKLETVDAKLTGVSHLLEGEIRNTTISHERTAAEHQALLEAAKQQRIEHKQLSDEHQDMIEQMAKMNSVLVGLLARLGDTDVQAHRRRSIQ